VSAGDELIERWGATERDLRAALALTDVRQTAALQIEEYLDHKKLGLAFEALVFELDERRMGVSTKTVAQLQAAVERIGASAFDADCLDAWERVRGLAAS
jgi:hypothetical protein